MGDQKPIIKKWWFWVIIVVILSFIFGNSGTKDNSDGKEKDADGISFEVSDVPNDVTGKWRVCSISENIEMQNYALDYYKKYFKNDSEIHAIVNSNNKTTTKISVLFNQLDVTVYQYVNKEEKDAKLLFSGKVLKEYYVNIDTGKIEKIR